MLGQCGATKRNGEPCGTFVGIRETPEGPRCLAHDPDRAERAAEIRSAGGVARTMRLRALSADEADAPPETAQDAKRIAARLVILAQTGKLDERAINAACVALRAFESLVRTADLEQATRRQLDALKQRIRQLEKRP